ncbi:MAG: DUF507 family protein [Epsilonproteobacteria bacterium]|nr:DUF507 family protein [Campylobacterota bacterium]
MKLQLPHAPYIANKIAIDLLNSGFVTLTRGVEPIAHYAQEIIEDEIKKEKALEERVEELLEEKEDEMEFMQVDRRNLFWLIKKRLAEDYGVILSYEDRFNDLAHRILDKLWQEDLINYSVSENKVKNVIYNAIDNYYKVFDKIEDEVIDRIRKFKRKIYPGSEEYDILFEKLYEEELRKRGML